MSRFRYEYGANPAHLLVALATFALSAWVLSQVFDVLGAPDRFLLWFIGAIVVHDLLFLPLYSLLGKIAAGTLTRGGERGRLRVAALNHLRVPALLSGLMLLVWFPVVLRKGASSFESASGLSNEIYLERWLLLTAVLFAGSALLLALRARRLRSRE